MPSQYPPEFPRENRRPGEVGKVRLGARRRLQSGLRDHPPLARPGPNRPWREARRHQYPEHRARRRKEADPQARARNSSWSARRPRSSRATGDPPKRLYPVIESLTGQGFSEREACHVVGVNRNSYTRLVDRLDPRSARLGLMLSPTDAVLAAVLGPLDAALDPSSSPPPPPQPAYAGRPRHRAKRSVNGTVRSASIPDPWPFPERRYLLGSRLR